MSVENEHNYEDLKETFYRESDSKRYCMFSDISFDDDQRDFVKNHWHEWIEIMRVVDGQLKVTHEGGELIVKAGEIVFIGSRVEHQLEAGPGKRRIQCLQINAGFVVQHECVYILLKNAFLVKNNNETSDYFNGIVENINSQGTVANLKFKSNLLLFLAKILEESIQDKENINYNEKFTDILKYISKHYCENITLTSVANTLELSPQIISIMFKRSLNLTFFQFIQHLRIDRAKFLLFSSDDKIVEIALSCGFPSEHSFISNFKKVTGLTPQVYRKKELENYGKHNM